MRKLLLCTSLTLSGSVLAAGAPVEDIAPAPVNQNYRSAAAPVTAPQPAPNQALTELYYEVQSLRDEVRELRGVVEEQANDLRQLRQRQMDDYQDLDRRLSASAAAPASAPAADYSGSRQAADYSASAASSAAQSSASVAAVSPAPGGSTSSPGGSEQQGEYEAYTATYNLLKARKIDEAVAGFKTQVAKFPNGKYTANSYYWLGEIYLLQNNLSEAENAFAMVNQRFPAHRKAPDAMFKLGKVYHLQGKNDKALQLLNKVASGNSSAASLARAYLNDNF